jgi:hypothetical protein
MWWLQVKTNMQVSFPLGELLADLIDLHADL